MSPAYVKPYVKRQKNFVTVAATAEPEPAQPGLSRFMAAHPRLSRLLADKPVTAAVVLTFANLMTFLNPFGPAPGLAAEFGDTAKPRRRKKTKFRH